MRLSQRFLFLASFWLLILLPLQARAEAPLRIAFADYKPYFFLNEQGAVEGFFYEIVSEALKRMGVESQWTPFPWTRCQVLVASGQEDALITVPTAERMQYLSTHVAPFYSKPLYLFTYANHPRLREIMALKTLRDIKAAGFSVITYSGNGWNKQTVGALGIPVLETPSLKAVWAMLAAKRGDLAIEWPGSAWPDISGQDLDGVIIQTSVAVTALPFHLLIRKGSPYESLLARFDAVIGAMHRDGTIRRILDKWGVEPGVSAHLNN